jgi:hypothetical protein
VAVARSLDLGDYDATLPATPVDHEAVISLSDRWGLDSPLARLVTTLTEVHG